MILNEEKERKTARECDGNTVHVTCAYPHSHVSCKTRREHGARTAPLGTDTIPCPSFEISSIMQLQKCDLVLRCGLKRLSSGIQSALFSGVFAIPFT